MLNIPFKVYKCSVILLRKYLVEISLLVFAFHLFTLVNGDVLYVSKDKGHDKNRTCKNITSPCQTLGYVIERANGNDVIELDHTNTENKPYNTCPTRAMTENLEFVSLSGSAVINCSGNGLYFKGNSTTVKFYGLKFLDTFLRMDDTSLMVNNCSFGTFNETATYLYIIIATIDTIQGSPKISINNSIFLDKNIASALHVVNNRAVSAFVEMNNVKVSNNYIDRAYSIIFIRGYVNFNFVHSEISNSSFTPSTGQPLVNFYGYLDSHLKQDAFVGKQNTGTTGRKEMKLGDSTLITLNFSGANFSFNQARTFQAIFFTPGRVIIDNTSFINIRSFTSVGNAVINGTSEDLEVLISNSSFVGNVNTFGLGGSMVSIASQKVVLSVTNCTFSQNFVGAVYVITLPSSRLSFKSTRMQRNKVLSYNRVWHCGSQICVTYQNANDKDIWSRYGVNNSGYLEALRNGSLNSDRETPFLASYKVPPLKLKVGHPDIPHALVSSYGESVSLAPGLSVEDCEFYGNVGYSSKSAALEIFSEQNISMSPTVDIEKCNFSGNNADPGTGAIYVDDGIEVNISNSVFLNNAGPASGTIFFAGATMIIRNCTLDSNSGGYTAYSQATGSVRLVNNGKALIIQDSQIIQRNVVERASGIAGVYGWYHGNLAILSNTFYSIVLSNSVVDFRWSPSSEKVIVLEIAHTTMFLLEKGSSIKCPQGYYMKHHRINSTGESFQCNLCGMGSYSIDRGIFTENGTHPAECLLCPYGGNCMKGLQALPNFWGYKIKENPPTVQFSRCPTGYCCQAESGKKSCVPYDTCKFGRHGRLCGVCKPGFTETLFTPSCRKSDKCNDYWFWPLGVIFILVFSLYLIIQPDIIAIFYRSITWFRSTPPQVLEREDTSNSGLERIVFFYYQAINILTVQSSNNTIWDNHLTQFTLGVFNFDLRLNREGFACPFPGLNPVTKLFFHTLGVFSVLFAIPAIFLLHKAMSMCFSRRSPKNGIYFSAFLKSVFLGYTVLAEKSLRLLQCVNVQGVNCLFVNCNIECYTWWQTLIGTLVLVFFVPFVFVLFCGSRKLYDKQISVLHFFLACLFPLPFLSYWFLKRRHVGGTLVQDTEGRTAVTSVLIGSYRVPDHMSTGAIYWESVLIGRMLVLIIAVLIKDPFLRSLALLLICIINLSLHIYVRPFERLSDNRAETLSLFCLVLLAMFNLPFMAYLSEGVVPEGPMSKVMDVFSWCQVVLVAFLPLVCALFVFVALVSQAAKLMFFLTKGVRFVCSSFASCSCCGQKRPHGELDDPLMA